MIEFERHSDCQLCPLCQSAQNPGLPSKVLYQQTELPVPKDIAILFVGQSPGFWEDKRGEIFIGYTGKLLDKMVLASELYAYADIFLANACRCKPPQGGNETQANIRACRPHLQEDIAKLQGRYKELIIFALGAKACYSVLNISSLNETLKKQGKPSPFFGTPEPVVFATYHPAMLHPTRQPGKVRAVQTHFSLVLRYLKGEFIPNNLKIEPELGVEVPETLTAEVSLDIETYGILAGAEQTVFHPIKSKEIDGVPFKYQIVTVSFGWYEGAKVRTAVYIFNLKKHRKIIRQWFRRMSRERIVCIGQNIKFDLLYLKFCGDQEIPYWIDPRRLIVDDTMIWSFLLFEQQPEKGLKELSTLYGIADYSMAKVTAKSGTAKSPRDKDLHYYNCLDSGATITLKRDLRQRIIDQYGKDSPKLSVTCAWVRNMIIWDTLDLEKNGSTFDIPKLQKYHVQEQKRCNELMTSAGEKHGIKLAGRGSDAPLRQLMLDCLAEAGLMSDPRVEWSPKTKKISIGVENVNLIKQNLRTASPYSGVITDFQEYKERAKIVSTYTKPILENRRKGIVLRSGRVGLVFPNWYSVPAYAERGGRRDEKSGGQIQGRFSCRKPARQTEPASIRECSCSRFRGGKLVEYDVSNDHLRMAALLSGDPELMKVYQTGNKSLHAVTAKTLFPDGDPAVLEDKGSKEYRMSRCLNFLVIFRGGAYAFQKMIMEDMGIEYEVGYCQDLIDKWFAKHWVYRDWQGKLIDQAARQGYLELPTGWSRTFGIGKENVEGQVSEICNFVHQTPCAQITESAQYKSSLQFLKYHLRSLVCLNIHDAVFVDTYPGEEGNVDEIVDKAMTHPPLLRVFEEWVGRTIPWKYKKKEYE